MKSSKGITLITLIISIIMVLLLASVTIVTSVRSYREMKFEGAKAEIEQVQKLVDEIASDYETYIKDEGNSYATYVDYFEARYNTTGFSSKLISNNLSRISRVANRYPELSTLENEGFYFSSDDLIKYFDLKGINPVVVDFNTRTVYSVEGIQDPDNIDIVYYTSEEWGERTQVDSIQGGFDNNVSVSAVKNAASNTNFSVTLTITGHINGISGVYYAKSGSEAFIKIDNYSIKSSNDNETKIKLSVNTASGSYKFKVVDELKNEYVTGSISL